jgi:hypothetical protein
MPTQQQIADALGVSRPLVVAYRKRGMPVESAKAAREWMSANIRPRLPNGTQPDKQTIHKQSRYQDARTRSALAEAEDRELAVLERRGVLVHRDKVRGELARQLSGLRDSILQIPARLQSVLAAETDEAKCHDIVQDELYLVLAQFSESAS